MGAFQQQSQQSQELLYEKGLQQIQEKLQKTAQQVGVENGLTFIMEITSLWYTSSECIDVTPLVRQKLGIQ